MSEIQTVVTVTPHWTDSVSDNAPKKEVLAQKISQLVSSKLDNKYITQIAIVWNSLSTIYPASEIDEAWRHLWE